MKNEIEEKKLPSWYKHKLWWDRALLDLPSRKLRDVFNMGRIRYIFYQIEPEFKHFSLKMLWHGVKQDIDRQRQNWENGCKGAQYGKFGGRPPKKDNEDERDVPPSAPLPFRAPLPKPTNIIEVPPEVSEQEAAEMVNNILKPSEKPKQYKPGISNEDYINMLSFALITQHVKDPFKEVQKFLDYNESKDWKDNKNKFISNKFAWFKNWEAKTEKRNAVENKAFREFWREFIIQRKVLKPDDELFFFKFYPKEIYKDENKAIIYFRNIKDQDEFGDLMENKYFEDLVFKLLKVDDVSWGVKE